ncbi:MAG: hypothetical protein IJZ79_02825 [Bacilli bacterium]|nr:hypothetical protein [Bacilli bacterium]MBQ8218659.1 hypothetical protein [Bacilli bacterium]
MFIFIFFLIVALSQFATNKVLNISDDNSVGYSYSKRDSLIIVGLFGVGLLFQLLPLKGHKIYWILCGIYAFAILLTMTILATLKKIIITKQREELQQIFDVLEPVLPKNTELDMNNPPFQLGYEGTKVNRITIKINPNTFKEPVAVNLCLSLNKYLPNYEWVNEFDFAARECAFVGTPLPPSIAKYKGSWLRPTEFIPIGLSGLGEVSWNLNSIKNVGRSCYVYDDGKIAKTVDTPSAPQALCVGSPLSLDTIIPTTTGYKTMGTIEVGDTVYAYRNEEAKVIEVHEIHQSTKLFKLTFKQNDNIVVVKSDEYHRWPVLVKSGGIMMTDTKHLKICNKIAGKDSYYELTAIELIDNELVRCIKVDHSMHLFAIGHKDNYVYTSNTGGGKAIYTEQEIRVKD